MPNYNKLTIVGNMGKNPETKATQSGKTFVTFPVAYTEYTKKQNSDGFDEKTTWFDCVCWDKFLADKISRGGIQRGNAVMVTGVVSCRAYAGSDGSPKATMTINVKEFVSLVSRNSQPQQQQANPYSSAAATQTQPSDDGPMNPAYQASSEDDLPF